MSRLRPVCRHAICVHASIRQNRDGVLSRLLLRPVASRAKVEAAPHYGFRMRTASGRVVGTRIRRPGKSASLVSLALHDVECGDGGTRRGVVVAIDAAAGFDDLLLQPIGFVALADLPQDRGAI